MKLEFKAEIMMLLAAITLLTVGTFCYCHTSTGAGMTLVFSYPFRGYAIPLVGFGSVLMAAASVSYSKRSKPNITADKKSELDKKASLAKQQGNNNPRNIPKQQGNN